MQIQNSGLFSLEQLQDQYFNTGKVSQPKTTETGTSFQDILSRKTAESDTADVRFSRHAANRLSDRNIELTQDQMQRLNQGTARAEAKGINESLVLVDSLAFIVNVPNQTVITAMQQGDTEENVFTNIDGAVII